MRRLITLATLAVAGAAWACAWPDPAAADTLAFVHSEENHFLGEFSGTLSYDGTSTLTVELTNDCLTCGYHVAGVAFNVSGDATAVLTPNPTGDYSDLATSPDPFALYGGNFGTFEAGVGVGGQYFSGGDPEAGIGPGETATFVFTVTGPDAAGLTALDFFSEPATDPAAPEFGGTVFAVRFRGGNNDSDNVAGVLVPEPRFLAHGLPLLVVGAARRRGGR